MRINNHSVETSNNAGIKAGESQTENSGRVNINHLMSKVRADYKKQRKENFVFVGLIGFVVVITGIIASL
tara:strand:+ start:1400 stop:1609 length:210 start_codon:yes stop_codon:yes gene_type:complete